MNGAGLMDLARQRSIAIWRVVPSARDRENLKKWATEEIQDWPVFHPIVELFDHRGRFTLLHGEHTPRDPPLGGDGRVVRSDPAWFFVAAREKVRRGEAVTTDAGDVIRFRVLARWGVLLRWRRDDMHVTVRTAPDGRVLGARIDHRPQDGVIIDQVGLNEFASNWNDIDWSPLFDMTEGDDVDWSTVQRAMIERLVRPVA